MAEQRPVEAAACLIQQGLYFQCNFQPDVEQSSKQCIYLAAIKAARPGSDVCEESPGIIDPIRTSLAMFGRDGLGTGFHVDRSQAENVAFPMVCLRKVKREVYILHVCSICNLHKRVSTVDQHVALCIVAQCEEYTLCCCVRVCVKAVPTPLDYSVG